MSCTSVRWRGDGSWRVADPGGPLLRQIRFGTVDGECEAQTAADEEAALLLLAGTFDLAAGSGSWPARGLRATPLAGRPCALYLPPATRWRAAGTGELLLVTCCRPRRPPQTALARPLLPLAGSGKSYDPTTGGWELTERRPDAPEAILPRRIETAVVGAARIERILPAAYKAAALRLDELVIPAGESVALPPAAGANDAALFVRAEAGVKITCGGDTVEAGGDTVLVVAAAEPLHLAATGGRAYAAVAWGGKDG